MSTSFKINSFGTPNSTTPSTIYSNKIVLTIYKYFLLRSPQMILE